MKRHMVLFKDANYLSLSNGGSQVYLHEESLCDTLGMADYLLLHFMGFYQSAATARAKIVVYHSAKPGLRPKDAQLIYGPGFIVTTMRPEPLLIPGPFLHRLDITVEVDDSAAAAQIQFGFGINATLFNSPK